MTPAAEVERFRKGQVLALVLNAPQRLNSLSEQLLGELQEGLREADRDDDVHVVLLAGRGRTFCAGADMKSLAHESRADGYRYLRRVTDLLATLRALSKPVVAAVQGYAVGGGAEIALEADALVLADDAIIRFPDVGLGSTPASTARLVATVGQARASRIVLLGEDLAARHLLGLGLVDELHPADRVLERGLETACRMAKHAPLSLRLAKRAVRMAPALDGQLELELNLDAMTQCYDSPEQQDAVRRFLQRS